MQKLAEPAPIVMHILVQLPQNPKVASAAPVSTDAETAAFGKAMESAIAETDAPVVPGDDLEVTDAPAAPAMPADPFPGALAVAMVSNPTVQAAVSVQAEPVGQPAPNVLKSPPVAMGEAASTPTADFPEAPRGVRLDIAVVEVPPQEDHESAVIEVDEEPEVDLESEEVLVDGEELEEPIRDLPTESESRRSDDFSSSNGAETVKIQAGERIETPQGFEVRIDNHRLVRELADRLEVMAAAHQKEGVLVQMEPPELGHITLLVKPEANGSVSAEITATHDQVRHALETSQPEIQKRLELRGVAVASVSVSSEASNYQPKDNPNQPSGREAASRRIEPARSQTESLTTSTQPIRRFRRSSGVDLWI